MLTQCTSRTELGLTAVTKLGAVIQRLLVNRAPNVLVQLAKRTKLLVTEVTFIGVPIPGPPSCPGLGRSRNESVRVRYKVGPVAFCNEMIQALSCETRLAAPSFKVQKESTPAHESAFARSPWANNVLGAMLRRVKMLAVEISISVIAQRSNTNSETYSLEVI